MDLFCELFFVHWTKPAEMHVEIADSRVVEGEEGIGRVVVIASQGSEIGPEEGGGRWRGWSSSLVLLFQRGCDIKT